MRDQNEQGCRPREIPNAVARWTAILQTATGRGFDAPPFAALVLGPVVHVDLNDDDPASELRDQTAAEIRRRGLGVGKPS